MPNSVRQVRFSEILQHADLLAEYAAECSIPEIGEVQPDPAIYAAMENAGVLQCFAAYQDRMVGFATVLLPVFPHYSKRVATGESIFVTESARKSGIGKELKDFAEQSAKEAGCVSALWSAPVGGKFERVLRADRRYRNTNSVFCRAL